MNKSLCLVFLSAPLQSPAAEGPAMRSLRTASSGSSQEQAQAGFDGNTRAAVGSSLFRQSRERVPPDVWRGVRDKVPRAASGSPRLTARSYSQGDAFTRGIKEFVGTVGSCAALGALIGFFVGLLGSPTLVARTLSGALVGAAVGAIFGVAGMLMERGD